MLKFKRFYAHIRYLRFRCKNLRTKTFVYEGANLKLPRNHSLSDIDTKEMFNNLLLKIVSQECFTSSEFEFIDIGANVGDTASLVLNRSKVTPRMILIEPSKYYFAYLSKNTALFPNTNAINKFVALELPIKSFSASLLHWGGTARIVSGSGVSISEEMQIDLNSLINRNTRLIKIDTDGFDKKIIRTVLDSLTSSKSLLYFENEFNDEEDLQKFIDLMKNLYSTGYRKCILVKNDGILVYYGEIISEYLVQVAEFQIRVNQSPNPSHFYYSDILVFSDEDEWLYDSIVSTIKSSQI
jgi:FkbM family methyltransferase